MFFCFVRQPALEGLWHLQRLICLWHFKWDLYESKRNCTPKQFGRVSKSKTCFSFQYVFGFQKNHTPIECGSAKLILATTISVNRVEILHLIVLIGLLNICLLAMQTNQELCNPPKQKETVNNQQPNTELVGSGKFESKPPDPELPNPPASTVSSLFDAGRHRSCVTRSAEWSHR